MPPGRALSEALTDDTAVGDKTLVAPRDRGYGTRNNATPLAPPAGQVAPSRQDEVHSPVRGSKRSNAALHAAPGGHSYTEEAPDGEGQMSEPASTVFVVDDNPQVRRSLCTLLAAAGLPAEAFPSAREFLATYDASRPGCLVLDLFLRGENGLDLQDELHRRKLSLPIIVLTAHGTVGASVRALKAGAIEFLQKPAQPATLLARIREALAIDERARQQAATRAATARRLAQLTTRERQILDLLVGGKTSKDIATSLGVSVRTVEGHRARIYFKTEVSSVVQLVRVVLGGE